LYVLSLAGLTAERPEIKRALDFLVATQKPDGSWPMISRSTPNGSPGSAKLLTPITCAACSWATLGLARVVPKEKPAPKADAARNLSSGIGADGKDGKLVGTWAQESRIVNGKQETSKKRTVTIKADGTFETKVDGKKVASGTFKVDTSTTPYTYTVKATGKTYHGIYELKGDMLKTCANEKPDKKAPRKFESKEGSSLELTVWKRVKP
jgi:uncharacterized protein (TIGR03067 family)